MATVRTAAPHHDSKGAGAANSSGDGNGKKRKRSRSGSSSRTLGTLPTGGSGAASDSDMAAVHAALAGFKKWQLAVNIDMSEIRKECMQVRREMTKTEDHAELAHSASEASAASARALKKTAEQQAQDITALVKGVKEEVRIVGEANKVATADADAVKTKVANVERSLEALTQRSIDEEYMLTQLSALQERYDAELAKCREHCEAMALGKQREIDALQEKLLAVESTVRAEIAATDQRQSEEVKRVNERVEELERSYQAELQGVHEQLQTDTEALKDQIHAVERNLDDVRVISEGLQGVPPPPPVLLARVPPTAMPPEVLTAANDQARVVGSDVDALKKQLYVVQRDLRDVRGFIEEQQRLPPPPRLDPHPIVPIEAFRAVESQQSRVIGDFIALASDFKRLTSHVNTEVGKLYEQFTRRLQDLGKDVFGALDRDTGNHVTEIIRLKDAVFDLQGDFRIFRRNLHRLEEQMDRRSPPRDHERGPRRYDEQYHCESGRYSPPMDRGAPGSSSRVHPRHSQRRSGSRSRSRSPGRDRHIRGRQHQLAPQGWNRSRSPELNQSRAGASNGEGRDTVSHSALPAAEVVSINRISDLESSEVLEPSTREEVEPARPSTEANAWGASDEVPPRIRPPRRHQPEVIVIEEEDEDETQNDVPPNMAPLDVVLEDYSDFFDDEPETEGDAVYTTATPSPSDAKLHSMAELNAGLLLYFCLGGAPNLDVAWTSNFYKLRSDECVDMPRALSFQRHHQFLQAFPMHLTQCVIQSVAVNASADGISDGESSTRVEDLEPSTVRARFGNLVTEIRLEWTNAVVSFLSKELAAIRPRTDNSDDKTPSLLANPSMNSANDSEDSTGGLAVDWLKRQSNALHYLYRGRGGSVDRDFGASPAVYLIALMFDVVRVTARAPQLLSLRLNAFGAKLVMNLWGLLLARLPYLFFADWTWLENQSEPKGEIPPLGFCHLLATILASNSLVDIASLESEELYKEAIQLIFRSLHLNGQSLSSLSESTDSPAQCLPVGRAELLSIELVNLDHKLMAILALDGCVDVCEAVSSATT